MGMYKWTDEQIDELERLYLEGLTAAQIAKQVGMTAQQTANKIQKLRHSGGLPDREHPKAKKLAPADPPKTEDREAWKIAARLIKTLEADGLQLVGLTFSRAGTRIQIDIEQ